MSIVSWQFAAFVVIALLVYYGLPHRLQNIWLLIVSCVFYAWLRWPLIFALAFLVIANLLIARRLAAGQSHRVIWLWSGITLNILVLVVFKYFGFFKPGFEAALGGMVDQRALKLIVPIGLSFTVLQTISFLVDIYRGQLDHLPGFMDLALYVAYFPKLVSGPIERARTFLPKLAAPRMVDNETLARSFSLVMVGLFRKIVIANQLALMIPSSQFRSPLTASRTGLVSAIYLLAYGFTILNDFAGYTCIVRGVSGFFGIELSPNFLTPYFSRSFTEFWNQWHISLSEWLRDYIYFPLTRAFLRRNINPRFALTLVVPPMVTMIISGLWHNVSLTLLVWGGLHGLYLAIERIISAYAPPRQTRRQPLVWQIVSGVSVFVLVNLAWIPFHAKNLGAVQDYLESLARPGMARAALPVLNFIAISLLLDVLQRRTHNELFFLKWPHAAQVALLTAVCLLLVVMSGQTLPPFIYQGF